MPVAVLARGEGHRDQRYGGEGEPVDHVLSEQHLRQHTTAPDVQVALLQHNVLQGPLRPLGRDTQTQMAGECEAPPPQFELQVPASHHLVEALRRAAAAASGSPRRLAVDAEDLVARAHRHLGIHLVPIVDAPGLQDALYDQHAILLAQGQTQRLLAVMVWPAERDLVLAPGRAQCPHRDLRVLRPPAATQQRLDAGLLQQDLASVCADQHLAVDLHVAQQVSPTRIHRVQWVRAGVAALRAGVEARAELQAGVGLDANRGVVRQTAPEQVASLELGHGVSILEVHRAVAAKPALAIFGPAYRGPARRHRRRWPAGRPAGRGPSHRDGLYRGRREGRR
mmetsp:Transcript_136959/g.355678  ORF Transcript_136959/g.355678 Transcript_136959/m.355678 type:complete len:338 (-) Transcript_136959:1130-2143(-)